MVILCIIEIFKLQLKWEKRTNRNGIGYRFGYTFNKNFLLDMRQIVKAWVETNKVTTVQRRKSKRRHPRRKLRTRRVFRLEWAVSFATAKQSSQTYSNVETTPGKSYSIYLTDSRCRMRWRHRKRWGLKFRTAKL